MEALFAYLISIDRISPTLLSLAAATPPQHDSPDPVSPKRIRRPTSPASPNFPALVLDCIRGRGGETDGGIWATWRFFTLDIGSTVWLKGMADRPNLNGAPVPIAAFYGDVSRICVRLLSGELLLGSGRNLAWCPPEPSDVGSVSEPADVRAVYALLSKALNAEAAALICSHLSCERCKLPCEADGRCNVPHSTSRSLKLLGVDQEEADAVHLLCRECGEMHVIHRTMPSSPLRAMRLQLELESAWKCWSGSHTSAVLPELDHRRCDARRARLIIQAPHTLQRKLDALPKALLSLDVAGSSHPATLVVSQFSDWPGDKFEPSAPFSCLTDIYMARMHRLREVVVNDRLFPRIKSLFLGRMPHDCVYSLDSTSLKVFIVNECVRFGHIVQDVVRGWPALEELSMGVVDSADFVVASNSLRVLDLRGSIISNMSLWAPNLGKLKLSKPTLDVETAVLTVLRSHPLERNLPANHIPPPLRVNKRYLFNRETGEISKDAANTEK